MLNNFLGVIIDESKLDTFKKISNILFILGIISIITLPLFGKNLYITEKQLFNANLIDFIDTNKFSDYQFKYFSMSEEEKLNDSLYKFCDGFFLQSNSTPYNKINSRIFHSPRGEKIKFIMINLIYNQNLSNFVNLKKANSIFYVLIKFISDYNFTQWLAKDIQINYITSELFYDNPNEAYEKLTNGKYNKLISKGMTIDGILNIDLNEFDVENIEKLLIKFNGVNSELVDMDYLTMFIQSLKTKYKKNGIFSVTNYILPDKIKDILKLVFDNIGILFKNFIKIKTYSKNIIYLIENIFENFFMINEKINTNHIFISNNYNSILFKIKSNNSEISHVINEQKINDYYSITNSLYIYLKVINNVEIDIFRGEYHYLYLGCYRFIGFNYLFILFLLTIRMVYEEIDIVYIIEFLFISEYKEPLKSINSSKILSILSLNCITFIYIFLHIENVANFLNIENYVTLFYIIIFCCFIIQFFSFLLIDLTRHEERFINNIFRFILILNCYQFISLNEGIGLYLTVTIMPLEFILLMIDNRNNNYIKIILLGIIIYPLLGAKNLINQMILNYIKFQNNIYPFINISLFLLTYRIALVLIETINKYKRGLMEDEDEEDNHFNLPEFYIEE